MFVLPFYFETNRGNPKAPSSVSIPSKQGEVLVTFQNRYKKLTDESGLLPIFGEQLDQYFRQAFTITLLNPKAIVFYMAFFPLFVDPARHQGLLTFGAMAITIAVLTLAYGLIMVLLTHFLAERLRATPWVRRALEKFAGLCLVGFGVKLALGR